MVSVDTSKRRLLELVGKPLTIKELEDLLFNLGMELEEIDGDDIKIDVTPDRIDMVSPEGLARAIRAYLGFKTPTYTAKTSSHIVNIEASVSNIRPYTACAIVRGLQLNDQGIKDLIWVQEKLHATFGRDRKRAAIGIYPMENITWPITYKADKPEKIRFTPLGENQEMNGLQILQKTSTGRKYAHLLEDKARYPYFIDDSGNILSMPPIINSNTMGKVTTKTRDVFIECSGHDFAVLSQTLNMIVCLLQDLGGIIYSVKLNYPKTSKKTPLLKEEKRIIKTEQINAMIGTSLNSKQCAKYLKRMMHNILSVNTNSIQFSVPAFRADIWHDVDIIDDVVRAIGVNNLKPEMPNVASVGRTCPLTKIQDILRELICSLGYNELFTFALTDREVQYAKMNLKEGKHIALGNVAEQSLNMLRTWLLPEGMRALSHNRHRSYPQRVFEIADIIIPDKERDVQTRNESHIVLIDSDAQANYTKVKQSLEFLFRKIGIRATYKSAEHASFINGRFAHVFMGTTIIGIIGEVHPQVLHNFDLVTPTSACEINIELIEKLR